MFLELTIVISVFVLYYIYFGFKWRNLPPGPAPWPLIGNMNLLGKDLYLSLDELGKTYGKVFRLYIGNTLVVVLSGDTIREAFVRKPVDFGGRPWTPSYDIALRGDQPLVFMDYGPLWKLHRNLGHRALKVYGQNRYEEIIVREVEELCKRLQTSDDNLVNIKEEIGLSIMNVICTKIFGNRYDAKDPEFLEILRIHDKLFRLTTVAGRNLVDLFPFLRFVLPVSGNVKALQETHDEWQATLWKKYYEHLESFDECNIRDYTDALIQAKLEAEKEGSDDRKFLQDKYLISATSTLFIAGSETTATTLCWAIVYLIHNPSFQERLKQELGKSTEVHNLESRKTFPLLEAFISETLRITSLLPLGVPHKTTVDTTLGGYSIPKGTTVLPNLWSLHHNPSIWKDPLKFDPAGRFLDDDGNFLSSAADTLLPFGAGPRACMGEVLARAELFLFLSRLVQKFRFEIPPGQEMPSLEPVTGNAVLQPAVGAICVTNRTR